MFTEADALLSYNDGAIGHPDGFVPAPMDAIEFDEMHRRRDPAFDLVDMKDIQSISRAGIGLRPIDATHGGTQREPADAPHAIDADLHLYFPVRALRAPYRQFRPGAP